MKKTTAKELQAQALEAFYNEEWHSLEVCMFTLRQHYPTTANRLVEYFEDIIYNALYT